MTTPRLRAYTFGVTLLIAPNDPHGDRLVETIRIMKRRGPPVLRAIMIGSVIWLLEGSHRIAACEALSLTPIVIVLPNVDSFKLRRSDIVGARKGVITLRSAKKALTIGRVRAIHPNRKYRFDHVDIDDRREVIVTVRRAGRDENTRNDHTN